MVIWPRGSQAWSAQVVPSAFVRRQVICSRWSSAMGVTATPPDRHPDTRRPLPTRHAKTTADPPNSTAVITSHRTGKPSAD